MDILVSIITVVRNDIHGLRRTYESILPIKHKIEWIVVDGDSIDGTKDYGNSINLPYYLFHSSPDKNMYDAMNKGIEFSHGKYLLFLNSGDYLNIDGQKELQNFIDTQYDIIFFNLIKVDRNLQPIKWVLPHNFLERIKDYPIIPHQSTLIKKSLLIDVGGYDISFKYLSDYDFFSKIFTSKEIKYIVYYEKFFSVFVLDGITSNFKASLSLRKECEIIQKKYYGSINIKNSFIYIIKHTLSYFPFQKSLYAFLRRFL